jgi:hypothetical protein
MNILRPTVLPDHHQLPNEYVDGEKDHPNPNNNYSNKHHLPLAKRKDKHHHFLSLSQLS